MNDKESTEFDFPKKEEVENENVIEPFSEDESFFKDGEEIPDLKEELYVEEDEGEDKVNTIRDIERDFSTRELTSKEANYKLKSLVGRVFAYKTKIIKITGFSVNDEKVTIFTKQKPHEIERNLENLYLFLSMLKEVDGSSDKEEKITSLSTSSTKLESTGLTSVDDTFNQLKDILVDNINRIRSDSEFIEQAEAISKQVDRIVSLAKDKIEIIIKMNDFNNDIAKE